MVFSFISNSMVRMITKHKQDVWAMETNDSEHATEEDLDVMDKLDVELDSTDLKPEDEQPWKQEIVWVNVVKFAILRSMVWYDLCRNCQTEKAATEEISCQKQ